MEVALACWRLLVTAPPSIRCGLKNSISIGDGQIVLESAQARMGGGRRKKRRESCNQRMVRLEDLHALFWPLVPVYRVVG